MNKYLAETGASSYVKGMDEGVDYVLCELSIFFPLYFSFHYLFTPFFELIRVDDNILGPMINI